MKGILMLSLFSLTFSISAQDIAIQEVLYDQPPGLDKFELVNTTGSTIDISSYWLCKEFTYTQFGNSSVFEIIEGNLNMPPGSHIKIRMIFPTYLDDTRGDFCIYSGMCFGCPADMVDFMQYGTNNPFVGRGYVAADKGIWSYTNPGELDFVPTIGTPGYSANWRGTNSGGGELTLSSDFINGIASLPVNLLALTGKVNLQKQVELDWITIDELNSRKHVIEKSNNGQIFNVIGEVSSQNLGSSPAYYHFLDKSPVMNESNYYRIRQIDYDGQETLSSILNVKVKNIDNHKITISPMPLSAASLFVMELYWPKEEDVVQFRMIDIAGNTVDRFEEHLLDGYNNFMHPLNGLEPGLYLLVVSDTEGNYVSEKFLVGK